MLLENKVAVIYGAGGPIRGAVARAFAREGARVFLAEQSWESWRASAIFRLDLASFTEPFSRDDGFLLQSDIRRGGVAIPLFDQQPGVLP